MANASLKFNGTSLPIDAAVTSIGRASDNTVSFASDSNVSRYHAEIERRGDDLWLIELGSSNGTAVNGQPVTGEVLLKGGDRIVFGGSSEVELVIEGLDEMEAASPAAGRVPPTGTVPSAGPAGPAIRSGPQVAAETSIASSPSTTLLIAGAVCGLAVIFVVAATIFYVTRGSKCEARAVITSPESGDTILKPTEIEVDSQETDCVSRAVFTVDGLEFASAVDEPYSATIDPAEFPDLADGFEHSLQIVLFDENGEPIEQAGGVTLNFETREISKPSPTPQVVNGNTERPPVGPKGNQPSLIEVQDMAKRLVKQFGGGYEYNVSNRQFLQEVQKKTAEYVDEGYFQRAAPFRDTINVAFVREQNLDAPLGYILAMSRSKFKAEKNGSDEGLWRMSNEFVVANAYNGACGNETLSDASQNCAAKAAAIYMKALVFAVFDGDVIYSSVAFGRSPQDAGAWKATLPANRSDLWNTIKTAPEREQLVRFFAAGIVGENPQKFGLKNAQPLSVLYRQAM